MNSFQINHNNIILIQSYNVASMASIATSNNQRAVIHLRAWAARQQEQERQRQEAARPMFGVG